MGARMNIRSLIFTTKNLFLIFLILFALISFPSIAFSGNECWDPFDDDCLNPPPPPEDQCPDAPECEEPPPPCDECAKEECQMCPVFAKDGVYQKSFVDLALSGIGPGLQVKRTYNSNEYGSSFFGHGWTFNFGKKLVISRIDEEDDDDDEKIIAVRLENGAKELYREHTDGSLERLSGYGTRYDIVRNSGDGSYTITNDDGSLHEIRSDGRTDSIIDPNGNTLLFDYNNAGGCLSRITNASGRYVEFVLGELTGKIERIKDSDNRTVSYEYDEDGNLITVRNPLNEPTHYTYDKYGQLTDIKDAKERVIESVQYEREKIYQVKTLIEKGEVYTFDYSEDKTVKTDSKGNTWEYYYNENAIIARTVATIDGVVYEKTSLPNPVRSTAKDWEEDENGNRTNYTYYDDGNIETKTDPENNTWTYSYIEVAGVQKLETETDPNLIVTKYEYYPDGNQKKINRDFDGPDNMTTVFMTYYPDGLLESVTDALGNPTTYYYDADGNLERVVDPTDNETTFTYDDRGNKLTSSDQDNNTTRYTYDLAGRAKTIEDPDANITTYNYDDCGNMESIKDANNKTTSFEYDAWGRTTKVTDPLNHSVHYTYDHNDNVLTFTDADNNTTRNYYNGLGRKYLTIDAEEGETGFKYYPNGTLKKITDANIQNTKYKYDKNNRVTKERYHDGKYYFYEYDKVGNLDNMTDPKGNKIKFDYDRLNRLKTKEYPDTSVASFTYDDVGRIKTATNTDSDGNTYSAIEYNYDSRGRVFSVVQNGKAIFYGYDKVGRRTSMTTPENEVVNYEYNSRSLMERMELLSGKGIDYEYDDLGRIDRKDYTGGNYSVYEFDDAGRLTDIEHKKSDGTDIYFQTNAFDNGTNILSKTTDNGTTTYTYDDTYQLLTATPPSPQAAETFTYDPVGNRETSADFSDWAYNSRNQLTSFFWIAYEYDDNGNTVEWLWLGDVYATYAYNHENRLTRVDFYDGSYAEYKYDSAGRRIEKDVDGAVTKYLYDGDRLLAEYDSSDQLVRNYFYMSGAVSPAILKEDGDIYYYFSDHLNTPQAITDENGTVEWQATYKAFGEVDISTESIVNNFRFPGQYYDVETNLYYNYHRYYSPGTGRYLRSDPIGLDGGLNLYIYVLNSPVNYIDPRGEDIFAVGSILIGIGYLSDLAFQSYYKDQMLDSLQAEMDYYIKLRSKIDLYCHPEQYNTYSMLTEKIMRLEKIILALKLGMATDVINTLYNVVTPTR